MASLAPYAMHADQSAGRTYDEPPHPYRGPYQRDRDRVVHSSAYRRLAHKTQVFTGEMGDYHRSRLTHTLEVASIARTVGRVLRLNEDLIEVLALLHDIGHPPFGHAGEEVLQQCTASCGGFDHNVHALRIVTLLEERYPNCPGLNLSLEVLSGQAQRVKGRPSSPPEVPGGRQPAAARETGASSQGPLSWGEVVKTYTVGSPGRQSLPPARPGGRQPKRAAARKALDRSRWSLKFAQDSKIFTVGSTETQRPTRQPLLEVQVVDAADSIAYNSHDADDALELGLLTVDDLLSVPLWREAAERVQRHYTNLDALQLRRAVIHQLIEILVSDLIATTRDRLEAAAVENIVDVTTASQPLARLSAAYQAPAAELTAFLFQHVYRHPTLLADRAIAGAALEEMFERFSRQPQRLPAQYQRQFDRDGLSRTVCDFLAGMTDRHALEEHRRQVDQV